MNCMDQRVIDFKSLYTSHTSHQKEVLHIMGTTIYDMIAEIMVLDSELLEVMQPSRVVWIAKHLILRPQQLVLVASRCHGLSPGDAVAVGHLRSLKDTPHLAPALFSALLTLACLFFSTLCCNTVINLLYSCFRSAGSLRRIKSCSGTINPHLGAERCCSPAPQEAIRTIFRPTQHSPSATYTPAHELLTNTPMH